MRIHCLQHVEFENLGSIGNWIQKHQHEITYTRFFTHDLLPGVNEIDGLIVMGGPMSVHDELLFPWLRDEKRFIREVIDAGKRVMGICLGAQLIAQSQGAEVYKNAEKEIGWFPIRMNPKAGKSSVMDGMADESTVFHWHGDTFDLPEDAELLALSEGCRQQAFSLGDTVLGLQFHLEITETGIGKLIDNCGEEIVPAPNIQSRQEMLSAIHHCEQNHRAMDGILERLIGPSSKDAISDEGD